MTHTIKTSLSIIVSAIMVSVFFTYTTVAFAANQIPTNTSCSNLRHSLSFGTRDNTTEGEVSILQQFLFNAGYLKTTSTGFFGQLTKAAVISYQTANGITGTGFVGPLTRAAIQHFSCANTTTTLIKQPVIATSTPIATTTIVSIAPIATSTKPALPYSAPSFSDWQGTWGDVSTTSRDSLLLKANTVTTGAEAMLPLSNTWTDYKFTTQLIVSNGDVTLFGRYQDSKNFVACSFSGNWLAILTRINGETTTVKSMTVESGLSGQFFQTSTSLSLRVQGQTIGCSALGGITDNLTYTFPDGILKTGGIGVETWQVGVGAASLELLGVRVDPL